MLRLFTVLPIAALVTLALFLSMYSLIQQEEPRVAAKRAIPEIVVTAKIDEPEIKELPETPPLVAPEPEEIDDWELENEAGDIAVATPELPKPDVKIDLTAAGPGSGETIIGYAPQYPERCKTRAAVGVVIVEFDVTEQGDVLNAKIIASDDSCFDREVLRTIAKWKFAPLLQDGKPIVQRGLRRAFRFELDE